MTDKIIGCGNQARLERNQRNANDQPETLFLMGQVTGNGKQEGFADNFETVTECSGPSPGRQPPTRGVCMHLAPPRTLPSQGPATTPHGPDGSSGSPPTQLSTPLARAAPSHQDGSQPPSSSGGQASSAGAGREALWNS